MSSENMNKLLYQRMAAEQARFRAWLQEQTPDVILDHAYSYTIREDIMMEMEEGRDESHGRYSGYN